MSPRHTLHVEAQANQVERFLAWCSRVQLLPNGTVDEEERAARLLEKLDGLGSRKIKVTLEVAL